MGNCLITKLKGIVNNDNLPIFNVVKLHVNGIGETTSGYQRELTVKADGIVNVTVSSGGEFTVGSTSGAGKTSYQINNTTAILYFKDDDYNIYLENKDNIVELYTHRLYGTKKIISIDTKQIDYCQKLKVFDFAVTDSTGDLKFFKNCPVIEEIEFQNSQIGGDLANISKCTTLKLLKTSLNTFGDINSIAGLTNLETFTAPENQNIHGSITRLSSLTKLVLFNILSSHNIDGNLTGLANASHIATLNVQSTKVEGNIDSLVALTDATYFNLYNNIIAGTVEGFIGSKAKPANPISMFRLIQYASLSGKKHSAGNCFLTWDNVNNVAVYEGGDSVDACPRVYTKGSPTGDFTNKTVIPVENL